MGADRIVIRGARQHNLKNIDLDLPRHKVIAVTGVSGSGKSSLVFDTIYAEGQRRYLESLSTYARQFIEKLERPDVDSISGISPTIAIRQRNTVTSARSTVGTATEIHDYLRLLFARVGRIYCPVCGIEVRSHTPSEVAEEIVHTFAGIRVLITVPLESSYSGDWAKRRKYLLSRGFSRLVIGGELLRIDEYEIKAYSKKKIALLIDRVQASQENRSRIAEAVELGYRESGMVEVQCAEQSKQLKFTQSPICQKCGASFEKPSPILFSFNSPYGACPDCHGFGDRMEFSEDLIVPDKRLTLEQKAIDPWSRERFMYFHYKMLQFCRARKIPLNVPWSDLPSRDRTLLLEGSGNYIGVIPFLEKLKEKSYKKGHRFFTRRYMAFTTCRTCRGGRLRPEAYNVKIGNYSIRDVTCMTPGRILKVLREIELTQEERSIAKDILVEIEARLNFMVDVGLGYLTLDRLTRTVSGGEAQRINLANSLGANLVDALYVLDEPSIGLHAADNERLISVMHRLRDAGNTVIVVEHDPDIIASCDWLVDLGPGPGKRGGEVLFSGPVQEARNANVPASKTISRIFNRDLSDRIPKKKRNAYGWIELKGVREHNLKKIDVRFPLGLVTCVTGVSGSGKSTLVVDVLYRLLGRERFSSEPVHLEGWKVSGKLDRVLLVDQSPIGTTPRSNPITYIKAFSYIRQIFASELLARRRGYDPGRFSFNRVGGRCPRCQGVGFRKVEMHFMADVFVPCEECEGRRYKSDILDIRHKGKNIAEVLDMTIEEALVFFDSSPELGEKLWTLCKVGLGYLTLGQPSNTLSGGEAQRIKIARELVESPNERNLYILDEPTTGLHMSDVEQLIRVLDELVSAGHTIVVIEHNMEVIRWADMVIDLGPGGGEEGGNIVACGTPEAIIQSRNSVTGRFLKDYMDKYGGAQA